MLRSILGSNKKKRFEIDKYDIGESELNYWSTVSVETDEFLVIVRVRMEKPRLPDIADYNNVYVSPGNIRRILNNYRKMKLMKLMWNLSHPLMI